MAWHQILVLFVVGMLLVYSKWWAWYGGWYWGPRFFLIASIPASLALLSQLYFSQQLRWRVLALLGLMLSVWGNINAQVFERQNAQYLSICHSNNYKLESFCWYTPEFSVLWEPFVSGRLASIFSYGTTWFSLTSFFWISWPTFRALFERSRFFAVRYRENFQDLIAGWKV